MILHGPYSFATRLFCYGPGSQIAVERMQHKTYHRMLVSGAVFGVVAWLASKRYASDSLLVLAPWVIFTDYLAAIEAGHVVATYTKPDPAPRFRSAMNGAISNSPSKVTQSERHSGQSYISSTFLQWSLAILKSFVMLSPELMTYRLLHWLSTGQKGSARKGVDPPAALLSKKRRLPYGQISRVGRHQQARSPSPNHKHKFFNGLLSCVSKRLLTVFDYLRIIATAASAQSSQRREAALCARVRASDDDDDGGGGDGGIGSSSSLTAMSAHSPLACPPSTTWTMPGTSMTCSLPSSTPRFSAGVLRPVMLPLN
ncbi:uncharacterized protein BBA_09218 [Beauveria bassiana ARSEF 2860]|uniref:Uncharacterized protein n=1 Tax=Beauveria bassiana (strain ARSEF 2860) TaxID=655819 RepID=J5J5D3_BEAB2|nr:uncharacterized protein BBA_09218 [Beauveria bassiana ARSEF 2860]EJP61798.1 hypothetical protein BBA_09218 [Beauveria bassiana ARSEF 2860]